MRILEDAGLGKLKEIEHKRLPTSTWYTSAGIHLPVWGVLVLQFLLHLEWLFHVMSEQTTEC